MSGGQHQAGLQPPFRAVGEEEFAMMFDHDRADKRKAQARAAGFAVARAFQAGEGFEHFGHAVLRDARAFVGDGDTHLAG